MSSLSILFITKLTRTDCEFQTRLPAQLVRHVAEDHDLDDALRPLAMPNKFGPPEVPMSVETLPAYMSVPLQVSGQPITADRHQRLGPWVSDALPS